MEVLSKLICGRFGEALLDIHKRRSPRGTLRHVETSGKTACQIKRIQHSGGTSYGKRWTLQHQFKGCRSVVFWFYGSLLTLLSLLRVVKLISLRSQHPTQFGIQKCGAYNVSAGIPVAILRVNGLLGRLAISYYRS
jgi:hypothetical protein